MPILWAFTAIGNVILSILLFARKYYIRYGFLLLWCISSVLIDGLALYGMIKGASLYPHYWLFIRYLLTFAIEALVIFEAFRWREWRVEYPVSIQLFLGILSLVLTNSLHYGWAVYYFECFTRFFNMGTILWMVFIFSKEFRHE